MLADNQPWTTSRCNRLLRPISSRIATLRKELDKQRRVVSEARNASATSGKKVSPRKTNLAQPSNHRKPRGFDKARDPDWIPGAKPIANGKKRTYGGRPGKNTNTSQHATSDLDGTSRPGEIAFTPLVARTGARVFETPQLHSSPLRKKRGPLVAKVEHMKQLKKHMPSDIGKLVEGLLDAYAKLLQATHLGEERCRKGARSLMGACLQKIPAYIELEEYFAELDKEEADEDEGRDVSNEVYTDLEQTFASHTGQGWRHFKQIVRTHGTSLLCDAIADDVLGAETSYAIVDLCMKASAWDEAERFLWTFLPNLKPLSTPNNLKASFFYQNTSPYMQLASLLVEHTGRHGFLYALLEHMIAQEQLPLEWLATECMRPVWSRLVRTLSEGDQRTFGHAFRFLETTIFAGAALPVESIFHDDDDDVEVIPKQIKPSSRQELRNALDTTFSSLLTILASICLVSRDEDAVQRVTWILDSIVVGFLKREDIRSDLELLDTTSYNMQTHAQRALWTMAASFLTRLGGCSFNPAMVSLDVSSLARTFNWVAYEYSCHDIDIPALLSTLPTFISSTARCTGKAWGDDGFDQLQRLVNALLNLSSLRLPHKLWNMKRLALEACMEYAQTTNEREHFAYARQVEQLMSSKGRVLLSHTPLKDDSPSATGGFRWEEGIGEWVTCTPFAKQDVKKVPRKPMRALELLPSPEPTESSQRTEDETDHDIAFGQAEDRDLWAQTMSPQSSPVKKAPRSSTSSLGKRLRASSPMVVIPAKRSRPTPPNSASLSFDTSFASYTSGSASQLGPRRSKRAKKETHTSAKSLRTKRSRSSLDSSLRCLKPKEYIEAVESSDCESESTEESESGADTEKCEDDRDELGKTPAGMKRFSNDTRPGDQQVKKGRGRPRKYQSVFRVRHEQDESGDELSFL